MRERIKTISVSVPPSLARQAALAAALLGESRSALIRRAVERELAEVTQALRDGPWDKLENRHFEESGE